MLIIGFCFTSYLGYFTVSCLMFCKTGFFVTFKFVRYFSDFKKSFQVSYDPVVDGVFSNADFFFDDDGGIGPAALQLVSKISIIKIYF